MSDPMTPTKRKPRKPKHALSPFPWHVVVTDPGFFDGRDKCAIEDANGNPVADYLFREDADAIVAAMNEKHNEIHVIGVTP